jgi:hypothetical protein
MNCLGWCDVCRVLAPHPALARHTAYLALELATALREAVDAELRDGRRVHCSATPAGVAMAAEAARAVDDAARKALRFLHAKERNRLHVLMERALDRRDRVVLRRPRSVA